MNWNRRGFFKLLGAMPLAAPMLASEVGKRPASLYADRKASKPQTYLRFKTHADLPADNYFHKLLDMAVQTGTIELGKPLETYEFWIHDCPPLLDHRDALFTIYRGRYLLRSINIAWNDQGCWDLDITLKKDNGMRCFYG